MRGCSASSRDSRAAANPNNRTRCIHSDTSRVPRSRERTPMPDSWDVIVVGSGAGGAAAAYQLVKAGKRVLMIEKGGRLPRDRMTLSTKIVFNRHIPDA